LKRLKS